MATKAKPFRTDRLVPPGEVLAEELEARNMTQTALAQTMARPIQVVNGIVQARRAVTAETALQLERALDVPAEFWMNLEQAYQLAKARAKLRRAS
ncbi:MAG: HigA family addiction module antidote protein [Chloroflexi bacterium]|nr:HigA family addiction module antidote protein [Chloroflexota bacterium]